MVMSLIENRVSMILDVVASFDGWMVTEKMLGAFLQMLACGVLTDEPRLPDWRAKGCKPVYVVSYPCAMKNRSNVAKSVSSKRAAVYTLIKKIHSW